jgi:hypothetical protein
MQTYCEDCGEKLLFRGHIPASAITMGRVDKEELGPRFNGETGEENTADLWKCPHKRTGFLGVLQKKHDRFIIYGGRKYLNPEIRKEWDL